MTDNQCRNQCTGYIVLVVLHRLYLFPLCWRASTRNISFTLLLTMSSKFLWVDSWCWASLENLFKQNVSWLSFTVSLNFHNFFQTMKKANNWCHENILYILYYFSCRSLLNSPSACQVPWLAVTVWGFADCPVTWKQNEHGYSIGGENLYSFIVFPGDQYWLYTAMGSNDICT